jgi:hypothetical protein
VEANTCGGADPIDSALRFVILQHVVPTKGLVRDVDDGVGDHWDWMFETSNDPDARLLTFSADQSLRLSHQPQTVLARRIADHRRAFLDVRETQEVSGDRGTVTAIASGRHRTAWLNSNEFRTIVQLDWLRENESVPDDHWRIDWQSNILSVRRLLRGCGLQ